MAQIKDTKIVIDISGKMGSLPDQQDARRKLTDDQKKEIKIKYERGEGTMRELAKEYGVSHGLIQFIVYPERLQPERGAQFYRPAPKKWSETINRHRNRKKKILTRILLEGSDELPTS